MTHDYKRHGTTDLFAAMNVATGEVLYDTKTPPHRERRPRLLQVHRPPRAARTSTSTSCSTTSRRTKHRRWPTGSADPKRARWHLHFTPTSSSWLNLVERWFSELTKRRLRTRGRSPRSTTSIEAIELWAEHWNDDPKPFVWKKPAEEIIAKVKRGRAALASVNSATHH